MTQSQEMVLVATVVHPERRFRIAKSRFDAVNAEAKAKGQDSPFILQEEGCEGGKSFNQLSEHEQQQVKAKQAERRKAKGKKGKK